MRIESDRIGKHRMELGLIRRLLGLGMPYLHYIVAGVLLIILASAAAVAMPHFLERAIDDHVLTGDLPGLRTMALVIAGLVVFQGAVAYLQAFITQMLGQKVMFDLRNRLFAHLQTLSVSYFDRHPVGRIITRVTSDVENLNNLFTQGIVSIFGDVFLIVGIVTAMLLKDITLALYTFTILPVLVAATFVFRRLVRKGYDDVRFHLARINAFLQENITGMKTVQLFLREKTNLKRFADINRDHTRAHERTILCFSIFFPLVELLSAAAMAMVIYQGGKAVGAGTLTFGLVFAYIRYIEMFFRPVSDLADKYNIIQSAVISSERIFRLLDTPPEVRDRPGAAIIAPPAVHVEIRRCGLRVRSRAAGAQRAELRGPTGRDPGPGGAHRRGQDHGGEPAPAVLRHPVRRHPGERARHPGSDPGIAARPHGGRCSRIPSSSPPGWRTTSVSASRASPTRR